LPAQLPKWAHENYVINAKADGNPDDTPKGTSFLSVLREQLGLKLVRSKGEVRTLIIDHVEMPSGN
jgi:uncharacterized protein (TIGR03435 family)